MQKLWQAELLSRNQGRSAAARYSLHPRFSRVRAGDLRQELTLLLADLSLGLASQVADWLILTGGESFWEEEWQENLPEAWRQEVISRLTATQILEIISQTGETRLMRLSSRWFTPPDL